MKIEDIIKEYNENLEISIENLELIFNDAEIRYETVEYIRKNLNRQFSLALLSKILTIRLNENNELSNGDNIMYACYLVGIHKDIRDSIEIWKAKETDFDLHCYVDIQLVVFCGVKNTIEYLKTIKTKESENAIEYITECNNAGDFDEIEEYFSEMNTPWWL